MLEHVCKLTVSYIYKKSAKTVPDGTQSNALSCVYLLCLHVWLIRQFAFLQAPASSYNANNNEVDMQKISEVYFSILLSSLVNRTFFIKWSIKNMENLMSMKCLKSMGSLKDIFCFKTIYNEYIWLAFFCVHFKTFQWKFGQN